MYSSKPAATSKLKNRPLWECSARSCQWTFAVKTQRCHCGAKTIYHQSQKEYRRWRELKQIEKAGQIRGLERQKKFTFTFNGYTLRSKSGKQDLSYWADFVYEENHPDPNPESRFYTPEWRRVIEDCKGRPNEVYPIKRELMKARGYEIRET